MKLSNLLLYSLSSIVFLFPFLLFAQQNNVIFTAHRGNTTHAPENSLLAVKNALDTDVQRIEVDVRMTIDSVLVLMHDKKINRTTTGKGKIKNKFFKDLDNYKLKKDFCVSSEKIPTLDDVFKTINHKKILVIEIKKSSTNNKGIEYQVVETIKKYDAYDFCIVHSFCNKVINNIHMLDTNVLLSKLFVCKPTFFPLIIDSKISFKSLKYYSFVESFSVNEHFASRIIIDKIHKLDKQVHVWTPNNTKKIDRLIKRGVDGIITDALD